MTKIEFNLNQNIVLMVEREITYVISLFSYNVSKHKKVYIDYYFR